MRLPKIFCLMLVLCLLGGCGAQQEEQNLPQAQMGNPWQSYETLQEAQNAVGFSLGMAEDLDGWQAVEFRVMNASLLELICQKEGRAVRLRKAIGSEDISGDYNTYESVTLAEYPNASVTLRDNKGILVFTDEYSWSVYCEDGFAEGEAEQFLNAILQA